MSEDHSPDASREGKSLRLTSLVGSAPLWVAADVVTAGGFDGVVVLDEGSRILGCARADVILRVAAQLSRSPLSVLPLDSVAMTVPGTESLSELERREVLAALLRSGGDIDASGTLVPTGSAGGT